MKLSPGTTIPIKLEHKESVILEMQRIHALKDILARDCANLNERVRYNYPELQGCDFEIDVDSNCFRVDSFDADTFCDEAPAEKGESHE